MLRCVPLLILAGGAAALIHLTATNVFWHAVDPTPRSGDFAAMFLATLAFGGAARLATFFGLVGVTWSIDDYRTYREKALEASEIERELVQTQLEALKLRLHPPFLFNALAAILPLIRTDPRAAARTVVQLGDILRLALHNDATGLVPLKTELSTSASTSRSSRRGCATASRSASRSIRRVAGRGSQPDPPPLIESAIASGARCGRAGAHPDQAWPDADELRVTVQRPRRRSSAGPRPDDPFDAGQLRRVPIPAAPGRASDKSRRPRAASHDSAGLAACAHRPGRRMSTCEPYGPRRQHPRRRPFAAAAAPAAIHLEVVTLSGCWPVDRSDSSARPTATSAIPFSASGSSSSVETAQGLLSSYIWAAMTPAVVVLAKHSLPTRANWAAPLSRLFAVGLALPVPHLVTYQLLYPLLMGFPCIVPVQLGAVTRLLPVAFPTHFVTYCAIVGATWTILYSRLSRERELRTSQMKTRVATARLEALKMQLHRTSCSTRSTASCRSSSATATPPRAPSSVSATCCACRSRTRRTT